jgi:hypothetical protein
MRSFGAGSVKMMMSDSRRHFHSSPAKRSLSHSRAYVSKYSDAGVCLVGGTGETRPIRAGVPSCIRRRHAIRKCLDCHLFTPKGPGLMGAPVLLLTDALFARLCHELSRRDAHIYTTAWRGRWGCGHSQQCRGPCTACIEAEEGEGKNQCEGAGEFSVTAHPT